MKFVYLETPLQSVKPLDEPPGKEIAEVVCAALSGEGPYLRGDYGWEWSFGGSAYKATAVIQEYGDGWLVPVQLNFWSRFRGKGSTALDDLYTGVKRVLGNKLGVLRKFESEDEFRRSEL
jgi:hypothetical protein